MLPSGSNTSVCTGWPAAFVTTTVRGFGRTSTRSVPTIAVVGALIFLRLTADGGVRPLGQRGREGKVRPKPDGLERDTDAVLAGGANVQLRGLAGGRDRLPGYGGDAGEMQPRNEDSMSEAHAKCNA
jgi:hypothetical protein